MIKNLRQGYTPSISSTHNIKITTSFNELLAEKSIDMSSASPILKNAPMSISLDPDMTNMASKYTIEFTSAYIVFGSVLTFEFPPDQKILSTQCDITSTYGVSINYACTNTSASSIQITHDLDPVLMISNSIKYTIAVYSVQSPSSMKPRTYKLSTYFNSAKNQEFIATISTSSAYPLSIAYTKSNDTIG